MTDLPNISGHVELVDAGDCASCIRLRGQLYELGAAIRALRDEWQASAEDFRGASPQTVGTMTITACLNRCADALARLLGEEKP